MPQTLGEYRVGLDFNPSADPNVFRIKRIAADFINLIEDIKQERLAQPDGVPWEAVRLYDLAQDQAEDASMWGVKAVTKPPR